MIKRIKILHLITSLRQGGAQRILYELTSSTTDLFEHQIWVIVNSGESEMYEKFRSKGIKINFIENKNLILFFIGIIKLIKYIYKIKPDLIQTWLYHSDLLSIILKVTNIPILWNIRHSNSNLIYSPFHRTITIWICSLISYFVPDSIICCSKSGIKYHKKIGYCNKFIYIPNGSSRYSELLKRKEKRKNKSLYKVGFFHRYNKQKDIETFLKAAEILKKKYARKFILILGGTNMGKNNKKLKEMIRKFELTKETKLKGYINRVEKSIIKCDLTVSSSREGEGCPNIIIESMSYRVPVVSTDCGDSKLIIGESGYVVPKKSPNLLAEKIDYLIGGIEKETPYMKLQDLCEQRWKINYQKEIMIKKYSEVWLKYSNKV